MRLAISIVVLATALIAPGGAAGQAGVTYQVPPDNPFVATAGAAPEVYAYGLRNPWRFSFDRLTGALLIGDVGASAREEIDWIGYREASGANFGWPCREGKVAGPVKPPDSRCPASAPAYVEPLFDFQGSAVTAGFVVRDTSLTGLVGRALFADFYPGQIRSLALGPGGHGDSSAGETISNLASFGEDAAGHLYVADLDGNEVRRLIAGTAPGALDSVPLAAPSGAPWDQPIAIAPVPGEAGSLFVAERPGRVRLVVSGKVRGEAILEIPGSPGVQSGGERGLLSVAAAPDWASSGKLYVYYTDKGGDIRVDEYTRRPELRGHRRGHAARAAHNRALERGQPQRRPAALRPGRLPVDHDRRRRRPGRRAPERPKPRRAPGQDPPHRSGSHGCGLQSRGCVAGGRHDQAAPARPRQAQAARAAPARSRRPRGMQRALLGHRARASADRAPVVCDAARKPRGARGQACPSQDHPDTQGAQGAQAGAAAQAQGHRALVAARHRRGGQPLAAGAAQGAGAALSQASSSARRRSRKACSAAFCVSSRARR